jgi:hypothetical protein
MAKKSSDRDEVQLRWHQFINGVEVDPSLKTFFQRHPGAGKEPRTLFEAVGEDLASSREDRREQAFWILVAGMPELADILHERETRQTGSRNGSDPSTKMMNAGMDIVSYLHGKLVKEHRFTTNQGKDPRPYVRRTARNWNIDAARKDSRVVLSLDEPRSDEGTTLGSSLAASLTNPTSVEDVVVNDLYNEHVLQQVRTWNFLNEKEIPLFVETYAATHPFNWIAEQFDTPAREAARKRQRISRARKKASERLDAALIWYLIMNGELWHRKEGLPKEVEKNLSDWWLWEWADCVIHQSLQERRFCREGDIVTAAMGELSNCVKHLSSQQEGLVPLNGQFWFELLPLTTRFDGRPGDIYIYCQSSRSHHGRFDGRVYEVWNYVYNPRFSNAISGRLELDNTLFLEKTKCEGSQEVSTWSYPNLHEQYACGANLYGITSLDKFIREARTHGLACSIIRGSNVSLKNYSFPPI